MHRVVTLPLSLASLILSAAFIVGVASCDWGPPEPECTPPEPDACTYEGEVIWTDPLCYWRCENVPAKSGWAKEL